MNGLVIQVLPPGNIYHPTFNVIFDSITKQVLRKCKKRHTAEKYLRNLVKELV